MDYKVVVNTCFGGFALSDEAYGWLQERYGLAEDQVRKLSRHDKRLVECVETLGSYKARGMYSEIEVETIHENRYYIEEYDGLEIILTPETTDWITIEDE